jgi:hypothetical protein
VKNGIVDFGKYMEKHNPEVVIIDLSPPYDENWTFFKTMRDAKTMQGRGMVLTTTNKAWLDEVLGEDSHALEVVGRPTDLQQIDAGPVVRSPLIGRRAGHSRKRGGVRRRPDRRRWGAYTACGTVARPRTSASAPLAGCSL